MRLELSLEHSHNILQSLPEASVELANGQQMFSKFFIRAKDAISGTNFTPMKKADKIVTSKKLLEGYKYTDLVNTTIYIPVGMTGHYSELVKALELSLTIVEMVSEKVVFTTNEINKYLAEPDMLKSYSITALHDRKDIQKKIKEVRKIIGGIMNQGYTQDTANFTSAFANIRSFRECVIKVTDLETTVHKANIESTLSSDLQALYAVIDKLEIRRAQDPNLYLMGAVVSKTLANNLFELANEVEFCGSFFVLLQITQKALAESVTKLQKSLPKKK